MCSDFESTEKRLDPLQTPCYLPTVQNHSRTGKILMILACSGPRSILKLKGFGTGVPNCHIVITDVSIDDVFDEHEVGDKNSCQRRQQCPHLVQSARVQHIITLEV